ncbi:TIGR03757 family integrating conjugative element protein [Citrobacter portucalensis]|uniref:TIGR03757 family integrating conjugative element protein n=1 Tax=Citrobacter portucalensis TaxID=1639133 RepID=UPI00226BA2E0|nr:TIGR03757 family integrating conjugative element protein [Citrobacter portucalensis]MCX8984243.1 TIGR03757 family integrating conjugative element protein [Citrobacter portucalensis]
MQHYLFLLLLPFLIAPAALAQTEIYTTVQHPVKTAEPGVLVYQVDEVEQLEQSLFPRLSDNPQQAEKQARHIMQQPDWKTQEAQLTGAYQSLITAWSVGIAKTPAVVFDNRYVVYGTTDIALAQQLLEKWQEQQP